MTNKELATVVKSLTPSVKRITRKDINRKNAYELFGAATLADEYNQRTRAIVLSVMSEAKGKRVKEHDAAADEWNDYLDQIGFDRAKVTRFVRIGTEYLVDNTRSVFAELNEDGTIEADFNFSALLAIAKCDSKRVREIVGTPAALIKAGTLNVRMSAADIVKAYKELLERDAKDKKVVSEAEAPADSEIESTPVQWFDYNDDTLIENTETLTDFTVVYAEEIGVAFEVVDGKPVIRAYTK